MVTPDTVWLADGFGEAFRPFRTARYKGTEMNSVKYFSSSAFGLVALRGQAWFSVHVKRPAKGDSAR
jgi:hypothetical protein